MADDGEVVILGRESREGTDVVAALRAMQDALCNSDSGKMPELVVFTLTPADYGTAISVIGHPDLIENKTAWLEVLGAIAQTCHRIMGIGAN